MRLLTLLLLSAPLVAAEAPRIWFSKSFPGSKPPYFEARVECSGQGEYREDPNDDQPVRFQMREHEVQAIFGLAEKVDYFRRPLESGLKVAKTGQKVFRYEGGTNSQVEFNYTQDPDGQALLDWFERIGESARIMAELERNARFDRLGVNHSLLLLQSLADRNRVVAADQFLPVLDRIAKNGSYINMARTRAANLADKFRASGEKPE